METTNDIWKLLRRIGLAYSEFLRVGGLQNTHLVRMTFLSATKKEYETQPVDDEEIQASLMDHLDKWLAETYQEMLNGMPPTPESLTLHVARKVGAL